MNVVDALAAYRLTRFVMRDTIIDGPRFALTSRSPFAKELLSCPWCTGLWVSVGVVAARRIAPRAWRPVAVALAISAAVGLADELV